MRFEIYNYNFETYGEYFYTVMRTQKFSVSSQRYIYTPLLARNLLKQSLSLQCMKPVQSISDDIIKVSFVQTVQLISNFVHG
jgi:hypothetical protein